MMDEVVAKEGITVAVQAGFRDKNPILQGSLLVTCVHSLIWNQWLSGEGAGMVQASPAANMPGTLDSMVLH